MDWIFQNIETFFPIIILLLYALSAWRKRSPNEEEESPEDPQEAERVRRIQEEIRRKIIARQQGKSLPAEVEPRSVEGKQAPVPPPMPPVVPTEVHRPTLVSEDRSSRLEKMEERLKKAQAARAETARALEVSQRKSKIEHRREKAPEKKETNGSLRSLLQNDLRQNSGLKRAFLLKEILGPPLGMEMGQLPRK